MTPAELRALVADCVALWGVAGRVEAEGESVAITTAAGRCVLRPADAALRPVRWFIETPERTAAGRGARAAPSIAAALGVVRAAACG
ncbi:MAG TPA: hypothetical protein VNE67_02430 [Acetobacteraceae bacterium]|nr:hypothetical protein [Acetobacteraceae bacterium]